MAGEKDFKSGTKAEERGDYREAMVHYQKAAQVNHTDAMLKVGMAFAHGKGTKRNDKEALTWFKKLAEKGNVDGLYNVGYMMAAGRGGDKDEEGAVQYYERAAKKGFVPAMYSLGLCYANETGASLDDALAVKWYRKAADKDYPPAQCTLGYMIRNGRGVEKSEADAVKWFRKAAERNYPAAHYHLGMAYAKGRGVDRSFPDAVKHMLSAANAKHVDAQYYLGLMYEEGYGVKRDGREAMRWYTAAASQGDPDAAVALARILRKQPGPEGKKKAFHYLGPAAKTCNTEAMFMLGRALVQGEGCERNEDVGRKWVLRAAEEGHGSAQCLMGQLSKDTEESKRWYKMAAEQGKTPDNVSIDADDATPSLADEDPVKERKREKYTSSSNLELADTSSTNAMVQHEVEVVDQDTGEAFSGGMLNGVRHGKGMVCYGNSGACFSGHWKNGRREGMGLMRWPDGSQQWCVYENGVLMGSRDVANTTAQ